jgi:uncharacterized protein (UPF0548 family)
MGLGQEGPGHLAGLTAVWAWGILPARRASRHGAVVLATPDISPARLVLSCRVVRCTDEARPFGFTYGTLLGHPERGEESFHVRLQDQGVVSFHAVTFSRPGDLATALAGPIATPSSRQRRPVA